MKEPRFLNLTEIYEIHTDQIRVALASAVTFLDLNGAVLLDPKDKLFKAMVKIASGEMSKLELADLFQNLRRR